MTDDVSSIRKSRSLYGFISRLVSVLMLAVVLNAAVTVGIVAYFRSQIYETNHRQQQQGLLVEDRLCVSLDKLAALKPPSGNPDTNPSRAFEQEQHKILSELGPDIHCPG